MTFDTISAFKLLSFIYGDYDGIKFQIKGIKSSLLYSYSRFWISFTIFDIIRFTILAILADSKRLVLEFYLCNFASLIKGKPFRLMIIAGPLFNVWLLAVILQFEKINYSKKYQFWLRFFQIPKQRTPEQLKLKGYSKDKVEKFWIFSSSLQNFVLKSLFANGFLTMSIASISYFFEMKKYSYLHTPIVFYGILIINSLSLTSIGTMNLLVVLGPIPYLYLTCKILIERFELTVNELKNMINKKFDSDKVEKHLNEFNMIIDDLQRSDFFFSKYINLNYHLSIVICSILFLCALFADDLVLMSFSSIMFVMVYSPSLFVCFYVCGQLHDTIKLAYNPFTKICLNKKMKPITRVRISRVLDFINSEYAGFRCSSLFLIRKSLTVEIFFSVIANTILLYEMIYFVFDV